MSEKKSPGQLFNEEMLRQQRERNAAIDARNKAAEEKSTNGNYTNNSRPAKKRNISVDAEVV